MKWIQRLGVGVRLDGERVEVWGERLEEGQRKVLEAALRERLKRCREPIEARLVLSLDGTPFVDFPVILRGRVPEEVLGVFSPGEDLLQVEVRVDRERPPSFRVEIGDEDLVYILRPYLEDQTERFLLAAREKARAILEVFGREGRPLLEALFLFSVEARKGRFTSVGEVTMALEGL
ncbi:hypothetical protein [Thermus arciformis]|uniref:hypothetical protein n=1 Tax=Thermus arciformis TaxID=482827 RepID=UPI001F4B5995|nr:hypothetical protein [Thermus arciformis]